MNNRRLLYFLLGIIILVSAASSYAKVRFDDIDLNNDDRLLFTAEHNIPGVAGYKSLFCTRLGPDKIEETPALLTCFPERMELLGEGKILQVRNMHGLSRFYIDEGRLVNVKENKNLRKTFRRTYPVSVSPDGKWYCIVEPSKSASGKLVLVNSQTLLEKVIIEPVDMDYSSVRVKWSPDGKVFLYENKKTVYFATPDAVFKNLQVGSDYRKIGEGTIESVQWTQDKKVIYLKDDIVYKIDQNELYTRGLYSSLVGNGEIIGRLPSPFDSITDRFWCNGAGTKIAVISKSNILELYSVSEKDRLDYMKIDMLYTLTEMSGTSLSHRIFWNGDKQPLIWVDSLDHETNEKRSTLYSIDDEMNYIFTAKNSIEPVVSPDLKKIAFTDAGVLRIFDISTRSEVASYDTEPVVSFVWSGRSSLYVGGKETVRHFNFGLHENKFLFLSSVGNANWNSGMIVTTTESDRTSYCYDKIKNTWVELKLPESPLVSKDKNGSFRAFLGESRSSDFENAILVRFLSGKTVTYAVYPDSIENEKKSKRVALVFDAIENSEGLGNVLHTLAEFGIKGTFFFNGEFIRRYPKKATLVANSVHECGSLFYTPADLVENNFVVDSNFISRGLARNEDEFFHATGKELSLLWHAPNYHANEVIMQAGTNAGYKYVSAFRRYHDRTTYESYLERGELYLSSCEQIDLLVSELRDGMIIPVTIGKTSGTRKDYLYQKLDILIAAILDSGYEITEVRNLLK